MAEEHTERTPAPLRGYRVLSEEEKAILDEIKLMEEKVGQLWAKVHWSHSTTMDSAQSSGCARDLLRQGFMELIRAVARPRDPYAEALNQRADEFRTEHLRNKETGRG